MDSSTKDNSTARASIKEDVSTHDIAASMPSSLATLNSDEYKRVGRKAMFKMDMTIMPILMIMFILNYLDRNNVASAKLANIERDLNLSPTQYQTCVSILFVGYILMQIPSNMMLGKTNWPGSYICTAMALWGVVSAAQTGVHSFGGLVVTRFFIGFVEAVFFPGALFYISLFYNRKQYAFRMALFYSGSQLGNAFAGLLAVPILALDGKHNLDGWRWLFLIEGVLTIGLAGVFAFILPNSLNGMKGLSEIERTWLKWNYEQDQGQNNDRSEITAWQGFVLAASDPKTWLLLSTLYLVFIGAGVTNFFPSVVATLGYSRNITLLLTAPPFILCCFTMLSIGFHSDRKGERYFHIVGPLTVTLAANIIAVATQQTAPRYLAMMLMPSSLYVSSTVIFSWVAASLSQPVSKRAAAMAIINAGVNTTNIWTPYLYSGAPRYLVAFSVNLATAAAGIGMATVTRIYLKRQNTKLDRGEDLGKSGPTEDQNVSGFRYML